METWAVKLANRLAWAFPGRTIDEGHLASWAEELAEVDPEVAEEMVRRLRHDWKNPPSVAELLVVIDEVRREEGLRRPALPERATWTEADEAEAATAGAEALARWHETQKRPPETPAEAIAQVVAEPRTELSAEEIEQRRRDQLAAFDARYGEEVKRQKRAVVDVEGVGL